MMKKTISVFLAVLFLIGTLIACGDAPKLGEATPTDESDTPELEETTDQTHTTTEPSPQVPDPLRVRSRFAAIEGRITNFQGTVDENGNIPWWVDWVRFEVETDDGFQAIIIGVHQTAFLLDAAPEVGMDIVAYISLDIFGYAENYRPVMSDAPKFEADGETYYIASAIISDARDVAVSGFSKDGDSYVSSDDSFRFITDGNTETKHAMWANPWSSSLMWDDFGRGYSDFAVFYEIDSQGIAVATTIIALYDELPIQWWFDNTPDSINLSVTQHIYKMADFEMLDLPIFVNGEKIDQSPIIGKNGVYVPFRPVFLHVGFGNYAHITLEGALSFGGGGGGSENSYWCVGDATVAGIGWSRQTDVPPIIVDGIIYVSLQAFFSRAAPFTGAWIFHDRIDIWGEGYFPFGPSVEQRSWDEELFSFDEVASMPVFVNGARVDVVAELVDSWEIVVPFEPIAKTLNIQLDHAFAETIGEVPAVVSIRNPSWIMNYYYNQNVTIAGIVHERQIVIHTWENLLLQYGLSLG